MENMVMNANLGLIFSRLGLILGVINMIALIICAKNKKKISVIIWILCIISILLNLIYPIMFVNMSYAIDYKPTVMNQLGPYVCSIIPLIIQMIMFIYIVVKKMKEGKEIEYNWSNSRYANKN